MRRLITSRGVLPSLIGQPLFKYPGEFRCYEREAREQERVLSLCLDRKQQFSGVH